MSQKSPHKEKSVQSILLRKGSSNKIALKEKIVQIYEAFFRGEDPSIGNANFWDEVFLLKVNATYMENEFDKINAEHLVGIKDNVNLLFYKCVCTLEQGNHIRIVNALQTLACLIRGVFKKCVGDHGFDVINILIGFDNAESQMKTLVEAVNSILTGDYPITIQQLTLKILLVLLSATENVSQNTLLEYLMMNSLFESLIQILGNSVLRHSLGHDAVIVLTLLVQYSKYDSINPYIVKLSILHDELALTGYAYALSAMLSEFNHQYQVKNVEPEGGFFSTITTMVGSMFVAEEKKIEAVKANDSILLALYEGLYLNRNFISSLTLSHTPASPTATLAPPTEPLSITTDESHDKPSPPPPTGTGDAVDLVETRRQPTNLLVTFLEYSSIVMQDIKDDARFNNAKLCLIILTCISEDQYANSLMHDMNINYRVPLHKTPMRHRKSTIDKNPSSKPLASALLDLMVEFSLSHLMKNFPMELYLRCIGVVHRVICYQKRCSVRLQYGWKELWTACISVLKFVLSHETYLVKKHDIFVLSVRVVNIFNLFITYGDTFLSDPNSYDELYYELIRMHQVFDNLYSMALRYTTSDVQWKESAIRLTNTLTNVRAIINHFSPKVDSWAASNHLSSLTEQQVLDVVKWNYDTLTLKLQDNLDQYERYTEKPRETAYFTQLVRSIVGDIRRQVSPIMLQRDGLITPPVSPV